MRQRHRTPGQVWTRRIVAGLLILLTPLLVLECILRATGFSRPQVDPNVLSRTIRASVDALNSRFTTDAFVEDAHLLWKLKPGSNLGGITIGTDGLLTVVPSAPVTVTQGAQACKVLC